MPDAAAPAESLWFLNTLVSIRVSAQEGSESLSMLEHRVAVGDSPLVIRVQRAIVQQFESVGDGAALAPLGRSVPPAYRMHLRAPCRGAKEGCRGGARFRGGRVQRYGGFCE